MACRRYQHPDRLALDPLLASRVTVRIESVEQLDYIDDIISPGARECSHVCLELDASWNPRVLGHLGTYRSPVFTVEDVGTLAEQIMGRRGFVVVGMMAYEGQIAGLGNDPSSIVRGAAVHWMRESSARELAGRRAEAVHTSSTTIATFILSQPHRSCCRRCASPPRRW